MTLEIYAFEDRDGNEATCWTTRDLAEARAYAAANRLRIIARVFEYADSELVEDYTAPARRRIAR